MTTGTDWDPSQHPRGEGQRFIEKPQAPSTAAFPGASGFLRHETSEGTFAFPPKRFVDVDEAVSYWSRVEVPEDILYNLQADQREHRFKVGGHALEEARARVKHQAMLNAVEQYPEPRPKDIHAVDRNDIRHADHPEWFHSRSLETMKAREALVQQHMATSDAEVEIEWARSNAASLPQEVSAADARTVARVVRMTELFEGDQRALRDVPVEWRGQTVTIGDLERHLGGFEQFVSCRRYRSRTEAAESRRSQW